MGERLRLTKSRMLLGTTVLTVLLIATLYHGPVYSSSGTCDPGGYYNFGWWKWYMCGATSDCDPDVCEVDICNFDDCLIGPGEGYIKYCVSEAYCGYYNPCIDCY